MKDKLVKISFVGDIMCEMPQLNTSKKIGFDEMFLNIRKYLKNSYVVGNLETPISNILGYTNDLYCFNTPKKFLEALEKSKFDLLMTANNHCLDRGIIGLNQTMRNIKKSNMDYVGTYLNKKEKQKIKIKDINGVKVAFIAYTYGTNYSYSYYPLNSKDKYKVNLIKEQKSDKTWKNSTKLNGYIFWTKKYIKGIIKKLINYRTKTYIDRSKSVVIDELGKGEWNLNQECMKKAIEDIKKAKEQSDIVIFMLHSGGQFNAEPGDFTKSVVKELANEEIDCIICTHAHVIQKSEYLNDKFIAYSLGNFSISPSTPYLNFDLLPDYSIILNCYINKARKMIEKFTFTIIKSVEDENHYLRIYTLKDLIYREVDKDKKEKLIQDNLFIYNRFLNKKENKIEINLEYEV